MIQKDSGVGEITQISVKSFSFEIRSGAVGFRKSKISPEFQDHMLKCWNSQNNGSLEVNGSGEERQNQHKNLLDLLLQVLFMENKGRIYTPLSFTFA